MELAMKAQLELWKHLMTVLPSKSALEIPEDKLLEYSRHSHREVTDKTYYDVSHINNHIPVDKDSLDYFLTNLSFHIGYFIDASSLFLLVQKFYTGEQS